MEEQVYPATAAPEVFGRKRRWHVRKIGIPGQVQEVIARHVIDDLGPDEQINDSPRTVVMSPQEWELHHADFGHRADFTPL